MKPADEEGYDNNGRKSFISSGGIQINLERVSV